MYDVVRRRYDRHENQEHYCRRQPPKFCVGRETIRNDA